MQPTTKKLVHRTLGTVLVASLAFGVTACGDDDDDASSVVDSTVEENGGGDSTPSETDDSTDVSNDAGEQDHIEVTAVDFAFEDLPSEIKAGTRLSLLNGAESEMHELVAIRIPDEESRPVAELITLPEEELGAIMSGEPETVLLAAPGEDQIPAVGDGTLSEPGRYLLLCAIPTGVDPAEYMAAAAESQGGPPEIEGAGPPHFVSGMWAELTVTA